MTSRIGVLASGSGSNLQAIIDACETGRLDARVAVVISNNSGSLAFKRASGAGVPARHLSSKTHPQPMELDRAISAALHDARVDVVVTAGYMKKLGTQTLADWRGKVINIHPSLLPRHGGPGMYGLNVHRSVIESGDDVTGITIHQVDGDYDTGPLIAQTQIIVLPDDTPETLAARVLDAEHEFLVETLQKLLDSAAS